jgi:hypothetical protein
MDEWGKTNKKLDAHRCRMEGDLYFPEPETAVTIKIWKFTDTSKIPDRKNGGKSKLMKHEFHCKFCGKPGEIEYEPVPEFKLQIETWKAALCCNRCGSFYESKRAIQGKISANCMIVLQTRRMRPQPKNSDQIIASLRTRVSNRCNDFAELVCNYLRIQTVNDESFPEMLMEKPDMVNIICAKYFHGLRKQFQP